MLTSLTAIKEFLNLPSTNTGQDTWLAALQEASEAAVKAYCGQNFERATHTEFYTGTGTKFLALAHRPVISVTSVNLDFEGNYGQTAGSFGSSTLLTAGTDYALELDGTLNGAAVSYSGQLIRIRTVWTQVARVYTPTRLVAETGPSFGNIKVVYTAGYSQCPEDLQYAVAYLVAYMRRTIPHGGHIHAETIGDYSYELAPIRWMGKEPEITTARQLLSRYREAPLGW